MKYDCCYGQVFFTQHSAMSGELLSHNRKKGKRKISDINKTRRRSVTTFCKQSSTPLAKNSSKRSQTGRNLFPSIIRRFSGDYWTIVLSVTIQTGQSHFTPTDRASWRHARHSTHSNTEQFARTSDDQKTKVLLKQSSRFLVIRL